MPISGCFVVGIKRMGQLAEGKAASLVSSWQEEIQKTYWHPFMTFQVDREDKVSIQFSLQNACTSIVLRIIGWLQPLGFLDNCRKL
jgi:hypothetical protein